MKNSLLLLTLLAVLSCDTETGLDQDSARLLGFWTRDMVYLNGVNSVDVVGDILNGSNALHLREDQTFYRIYDLGTWHLCGQTLTLDRDESGGMMDWTYTIIELTGDRLILETNLTESQYCCGFEAFSDDEIITIREFYSRQDE